MPFDRCIEDHKNAGAPGVVGIHSAAAKRATATLKSFSALRDEDRLEVSIVAKA